ncbi:hypothetical protein CANDROIZ_490007 [Candidatus Roizmanbacteria bacterium]|nr:hypothetical protein CANDROIZ_490007 [Candidatus Roizmanbacteria bacterium]
MNPGGSKLFSKYYQSTSQFVSSINRLYILRHPLEEGDPDDNYLLYHN